MKDIQYYLGNKTIKIGSKKILSIFILYKNIYLKTIEYK